MGGAAGWRAPGDSHGIAPARTEGRRGGSDPDGRARQGVLRQDGEEEANLSSPACRQLVITTRSTAAAPIRRSALYHLALRCFWLGSGRCEHYVPTAMIKL